MEAPVAGGASACDDHAMQMSHEAYGRLNDPVSGESDSAKAQAPSATAGAEPSSAAQEDRVIPPPPPPSGEERPSKRDLKEEAESLEHLLHHDGHNKHCDACHHAKL